MRSCRSLLGSVLALGIVAQPALAMPASDSPTPFGCDGRELVGFPGGMDARTTAMALLPDGRAILAGWVSQPFGNTTAMGIVRTLQDGRLDPTFGSDGQVVTTGQSPSTDAVALIPRPDGSIIVVGRGLWGSTALAAYREDG